MGSRVAKWWRERRIQRTAVALIGAGMILSGPEAAASIGVVVVVVAVWAWYD